ncbi:MAG: hypothetical protein IJS46_02780, partial [Kiritimatiellae bacterium]|nr:hypothetical protein [Kiritimatiellia bacterium]
TWAAGTGGASWDSAKHVLVIPAGDYLVFDSAWKSASPTASGTFYGANPGLSIVLDGDCAIAISNVVAVSGNAENGVNSVIDLAGHDLALELIGRNTFSVKVETQNIGPAIHVPAASSLTIDGTGSLYAHVYGGAPACIGSNYKEESGSITINGGTVGANHQDLDKCRKGGSPGVNGAAIGCGGAANAGRITINGGVVAATNECWGAGIGAGGNYNGDGHDTTEVAAVAGAGAFDILIAGGTVTAVGGRDGGSGIGGGHSYRRGSTTGACTSHCPIRILGGTVAATAGSSSTATCGTSAIGAAMANAGAAVVVDGAATVIANAGNANNQNTVSGYNPVSAGSLSFTCRDGVEAGAEGHVFFSASGSASVKDVMPESEEALAALPWATYTKDAVRQALQRASNSSGGTDYSFAAGTQSAALEGLPITAFSLDGSVAHFTYARTTGEPTDAQIEAFSAWFAAFGEDVVALARTDLAETSATPLAQDAGTAADNGDGTASFAVTLAEPLAPAQFFQIAW